MPARTARLPLPLLLAAALAQGACESGDDPSLPDLPPGPECATLRPAFTPCGGDLARTWRLQGVCADGAPWDLERSPYCAEREGRADVRRTGIVVVESGTLTTFVDLWLEVVAFQAPASCFTGPCQDATVVDDWNTECTRSGDGCQCEGRHPWAAPSSDPRPVRLEGTDLVLLDAEGAETARWPYCVQGDQAFVLATEAPQPGLDPVPVLWVLGP